MGFETLLLGAAIGGSALSSISNAKKQANAIVKEGNAETSNFAKKIKYAAADRQVSFLQAGLELEGTPIGVINDVYDTGTADLSQMIDNYNTKSKRAISEGRTQAWNSIISGFSMAGAGSAASGIGKGLNSVTGGYTSQIGLTGGFDPSTGINWDSGRSWGSYF